MYIRINVLKSISFRAWKEQLKRLRRLSPIPQMHTCCSSLRTQRTWKSTITQLAQSSGGILLALLTSSLPVCVSTISLHVDLNLPCLLGLLPENSPGVPCFLYALGVSTLLSFPGHRCIFAITGWVNWVVCSLATGL